MMEDLLKYLLLTPNTSLTRSTAGAVERVNNDCTITWSVGTGVGFSLGIEICVTESCPL